MFEKELAALERAGRLRKRKLFHGDHPSLIDLASNDYLRLAHKKKLFNATIKSLKNHGCYGPKASQLVSGYHPIHADFERFLIQTHRFEAALVIGSGFLGNLALFESLIRRGDVLLLDRHYHASGQLAAKTVQGEVIFFDHNDAVDLAAKLAGLKARRVFIALEGIYSMGGDYVARSVLQTALDAEATVILDEAHSSGVTGPHLRGILDAYKITDRKGIIKLGTLGKAYGSYGAYILAEQNTIAFLENRAKALIYTTAPSLYDIAYAHHAARYIEEHAQKLHRRLKKACQIAREAGYETAGPILPIPVGSDRAAIDLGQKLLKKGYLVGTIRRPTVEQAQLRVILRARPKKLKSFFKTLTHIF
jgi:8-amino-7-oxononanoate synthase